MSIYEFDSHIPLQPNKKRNNTMPRKTITNFISDVKGYGFTALLSLGLGVGLFIFGKPLLAGICFGVFATRNWDIIETYLRDELNII